VTKRTLVGYYARSLTPRRHSTVPPTRDTAAEVSKSLELEQRIARIEIQVNELLVRLELQSKRSVALQAQVDHLLARLFHI
jgi:hypothetical protein